MNRLYLTQDTIGSPSGGGIVTKNEYEALAAFGTLGSMTPLDARLVGVLPDPFEADAAYLQRLQSSGQRFDLAHVYAGCFSETVRWLKSTGTKVTYTAAAHDPDKSKEEFRALGLPYLQHLSDPVLRTRYVEGYRLADVVICPSSYSARIMRELFGCLRVQVIPHGVESLPLPRAPMPLRFTVGYLGQGGPDKGLRHLLAAWKALDWTDASLVIGGNNIDAVLPLWRQIGGRVQLLGWVKDLDEFYGSLSLYVQPSVTEGFGIEIIEALARGVMVVASRGAGASEFIPHESGYTYDDPAQLPEFLRPLKGIARRVEHDPQLDRFEWSWIREQYTSLWRSL